VFGHSFNINHIVRKYCEQVCDESGTVAAQFLLDLIEIGDNFMHSVLLLSLNKVCEVIGTPSYAIASVFFQLWAIGLCSVFWSIFIVFFSFFLHVPFI